LELVFLTGAIQPLHLHLVFFAGAIETFGLELVLLASAVEPLHLKFVFFAGALQPFGLELLLWRRPLREHPRDRGIAKVALQLHEWMVRLRPRVRRRLPADWMALRGEINVVVAWHRGSLSLQG
jgi:hypothetical protein